MRATGTPCAHASARHRRAHTACLPVLSPWHKPMVVNGTVVGPFEEEEEGTSIASNVVKVEGEDPATQVL